MSEKRGEIGQGYIFSWLKLQKLKLACWENIFRERSLFMGKGYKHSAFNSLKVSMFVTASYLSSFTKCKNYFFRSVLVGSIFSQVSPGIPQQVANLIGRCQVTIQL